MDYLRAGWRLSQSKDQAADGTPYGRIMPEPGQTVFEAIALSESPDHQTYVLDRWSSCFAVLNIYPYASGHIMVLPREARTSLDDLDQSEFTQLWELVRVASQACRSAFRPDGMNIGLNIGRAGGASIPTHLHVHVVPRWDADTNFMTTTADARVLPVTLDETWSRLRAVWPSDMSEASSPGKQT